MRGLSIFFVVSLGLHALALTIGSVEGRVIDQPLALSASIRLPAKVIEKPVAHAMQKAPQSRQVARKVSQVTQPTVSAIEAAAGQAVASGPEESKAPVQEAKHLDPVVRGFWEDDIEQRIKQAGLRFFTGQPGRARVVMVLSGAGELIELSVTGEAAGMAEAAIRSIQRWPRFEGEPRSFRRVLAFVVA